MHRFLDEQLATGQKVCGFEQEQYHPARPGAAPAARPVFRLVRLEPELKPQAKVPEPPPDVAGRPGLKNPLVRFMTSYADAIDEQIKLIMDL